jgi:hypothetical protein
MIRAFFACAAVAALVAVAPYSAAEAGEKAPRKTYSAKYGVKPVKKAYRGYRKPQVRGFYADRRGGYSYSVPDTINTYGDSRSLYGATLMFRDPMLDRQTNAGPFDHGFFFDSGIAPRGGNSPYMH